MARVGTTPRSLIVAAGLILDITALRNILAAGRTPAAPPPSPPPEALARWMPALSPITIPELVTPVVVAVLVIFTTAYPATGQRVAIFGVAAGLMFLNLLAMLGARAFMHRVGMAPISFLGAIFGGHHAALGVEFLSDGRVVAIDTRTGV